MNSRLFHPVVLGILSLTFFLQSYTASLMKTPTMDEPIHIAAGLSYMDSHRIVLNPEHPPLLKELSGVFLLASGVRWPNSPEATAMLNNRAAENKAVLDAIVSTNDRDKVLFWARLPFILLTTSLVFALYLLARHLLGETAALGAVLLYALDPNMLAHSFLVTTDAGLTVFVVVFLLALWRYLQQPGWKRVLFCGVALGAALAAKFSAVVLLPITVVLIAAAAIWPVQVFSIEPIRPIGRNVLCSCGSGKKYKHCHGKQDSQSVPSISGVRTRMLKYAIALVGMCAAAFVVIETVYFFPKDPLQYIAGMRLINANHVPDYQAYMAGRMAPRFYSYYAVAYLLKEPLAAIVLTVIGVVFLFHGKTILPLARVFVLVPMTALFVGYTLFSDNIGIRYILPVFPFTYMLGGVGLAALLRKGTVWKWGLAVPLCVWLVVAATGIYPDHLSYFNEAACLLDKPGNIGVDGGSRCGPTWLDDSNVDWGQGLKQLKTWLDQNSKGRTVRLAYLGPFPPEKYGIKSQSMDDEDLLTGQKPGLYAVSTHIVASTPGVARQSLGRGAEWLRTTPPIAVVGHAFYIYDIPEKRGQ